MAGIVKWFKSLNLTEKIILIFLLALLGIDIWLSTTDHQTISQVVFNASPNHPIIPAIFGIFTGHFFLRFKRLIPKRLSNVLLIVVIVFLFYLMFTGYALMPDKIMTITRRTPIVVVAVFTAVGGCLWPQSK